jgi:D-alanyl-D-alanine dipeptidase
MRTLLLVSFLLSGLGRVHAASPSKAPQGEAAGLVDATTIVPGLVLDLRYATENNFLKRRLYDAPVCLLRKPVAERLAVAQRALAEKGLRLKVFDCYRPFSVQKAMWALKPQRGFVAPPALGGSNHNRGAAVDVSLVGRDGNELEMPTPFDDFTRAAFSRSDLPSAAAKKNRGVLQSALSTAGFKGVTMEWWHFDAPDALEYKTLDEPLAQKNR